MIKLRCYRMKLVIDGQCYNLQPSQRPVDLLWKIEESMVKEHQYTVQQVDIIIPILRMWMLTLNSILSRKFRQSRISIRRLVGGIFSMVIWAKDGPVILSGSSQRSLSITLNWG